MSLKISHKTNQNQINLFWGLSFLCLCACQPAHDASGKKKAEIHANITFFATRPDTEIFFKNVRQIFYQKNQIHFYLNTQTQQPTEIDTYSNQKFSQNQPFTLQILHHWQKSGVNVWLKGNPKKVLILTKKNKNVDDKNAKNESAKNENIENKLENKNNKGVKKSLYDTLNVIYDHTKINASFVLANQIYQAITQEKQIFWVNDQSQGKDFFQTQADKEAWRVTFKDFLALIGKN